MTQAETLASSFDYARKMSIGYFKKIQQSADIYKEFAIEGKKLNCAYWIYGHLAVTENYLLLRSTGGEIERFAWAKPFGLGGSLPDVNERVSVEEITTTLQQVHDKSISWIKSLTDDQLKEPNKGGMNFGDGSIADLIKHAIAHEASHAGHLGWICKLSGIKTI